MIAYVFDSAPLSCFARARHLAMLDRLTEGADRVTTHAVLSEIRNGIGRYPELQGILELRWLRVESASGLEELHGAIAFTDDEAAVQAAKDEGVRVRRTLALVARGMKRGMLDEVEADRLVDDLIRGGGRFPFRSGEFVRWARERHLL